HRNLDKVCRADELIETISIRSSRISNRLRRIRSRSVSGGSGRVTRTRLRRFVDSGLNSRRRSRVARAGLCGRRLRQLHRLLRLGGVRKGLWLGFGGGARAKNGSKKSKGGRIAAR